jgi:riboflavin kinase / FMN adenylyltransferase
MLIFRHFQDLPPEARGAVLAIGNFDGVHRGHQVVLAETAAVARSLAAPLAVMCFEPHPRQVFRPADPPFRLTPFRERARLLQELGVAIHIVLHFDLAFSRITADDFAATILKGALGVRHVAIGFDFCFGHQRAGNAQTLRGFGERHGFGVTIVTAASDEAGGIFSSSRIRELLVAGNPRMAAELLGRPFEIEGRVVEGDRRGRTLGFPTANIEIGDYLRPAYGVYAIRAALEGPDPPDWHDGVASFGIRPMYRLAEPLLEAHLFDFSGDLYGRHLRVQLVDYLRQERRFDSVDALIQQMARDSENARLALRH